MDELTYIFISALANAVCMGVALYIGFRKGVERAVDLVLDRLQQRYMENEKMREFTGSAVELFRNLNELVRSGEVKSLIADVSVLVRQLSTPPRKRTVKTMSSE